MIQEITQIFCNIIAGYFARSDLLLNFASVKTDFKK